MPGRKGFRVRWTGAAKLDLGAIVDYLSDENPENAEGILDRLELTASRLERLPERGRIVPELKEQGMTLYRELICRP